MARAVRRRKDPREAVLALAPLAVETLAEIMRGAGSDTARIAAAREVRTQPGVDPDADLKASHDILVQHGWAPR